MGRPTNLLPTVCQKRFHTLKPKYKLYSSDGRAQFFFFFLGQTNTLHHGLGRDWGATGRLVEQGGFASHSARLHGLFRSMHDRFLLPPRHGRGLAGFLYGFKKFKTVEEGLLSGLWVLAARPACYLCRGSQLVVVVDVVVLIDGQPGGGCMVGIWHVSQTSPELF